MHTSRTPTGRVIDYSASLKSDGSAALRKQIVSFIRGVRGERQNAVTAAQITAWFRATPSEFVLARLAEVVAQGEVRVCMSSLTSGRRHNGRTVYEATAWAAPEQECA